MPRGVPKSGQRAARKSLKSMPTAAVFAFETDEQIDAKLKERFEILEELAESSTRGDVRSLIVSGPAGLGKSFTVEKILQEYDPTGFQSTFVKGYVRATGLFKMLYQHRDAGSVLVFDDADSIFFDDVSLNLMKAACDSSKRRTISWMSEAKLEDADGDNIPRTFQFEGTIIFITNYDFDAMIDRGHKLAPHLTAMMSRSHYIDLAMKSKRDYYIRIRQVVEAGLLDDTGLTAVEQREILSFVDKNFNSLRETSLRMVLKIAALRKTSASKFESMARVTCMVNR